VRRGQRGLGHIMPSSPGINRRLAAVRKAGTITTP